MQPFVCTQRPLNNNHKLLYVFIVQDDKWVTETPCTSVWPWVLQDTKWVGPTSCAEFKPFQIKYLMTKLPYHIHCRIGFDHTCTIKGLVISSLSEKWAVCKGGLSKHTQNVRQNQHKYYSCKLSWLCHHKLVHSCRAYKGKSFYCYSILNLASDESKAEQANYKVTVMHVHIKNQTYGTLLQVVIT